MVDLLQLICCQAKGLQLQLLCLSLFGNEEKPVYLPTPRKVTGIRLQTDDLSYIRAAGYHLCVSDHNKKW